MFDDYDIFEEPSEADKIIREAKAALGDLLMHEVKQTMENAAGARDRLESLQREIRAAEYKLRCVQEQIQKAQEKLESSELYDVPKKYIDRFVRNATGDFAPGDVVYVIKDKGNWESCPTCRGKKKVNASVADTVMEISCPTCGGRGEKFKSIKEVEKTKITAVHLKLCFSENRVNYWNTECVYVGSSEICTAPKNIYLTEEAAQNAINQIPQKPCPKY